MFNFFINSGHSFFSLRQPLIIYLLKKNLKLKIFTPNNIHIIKKKIKSKNLSTIKLNLNEEKENINNLIINFINIYKVFKSNNKTTNIIFGSYLNLIFGLLSFFIKAKKNIFVFTGMGSFFNSDKKLKILIIRFLFNLVILKKNSFFIFYNSFDRNFLLNKIFFERSKIIFGSGILLKKKNTYKKINKKIKFVYYSRFNLDKGVLDLIKAIDIINLKGYGKFCEFYFYGLFDKNPTNISREKLKELIKLNKNCHFKETNYKSNLNKIFLNKHVFILPSHREGLPKTALEAMNHDNALLLSDIPGHKLLIAKKYVNGLFFKKKNEKDLSKKIVWMINNKKEVIKFINNSKKNLSKFSTQNINKKFYETITKI